MNDSRSTAKTGRLASEMERMDESLPRRPTADVQTHSLATPSQSPLEFARLQVQAWCARAARQQKYDGEAAASTALAITRMDRNELTATIRALAHTAQSTPRRPTA
jgi:hypothetical protein